MVQHHEVLYLETAKSLPLIPLASIFLADIFQQYGAIPFQASVMLSTMFYFVFVPMEHQNNLQFRAINDAKLKRHHL